MLTRSLPLGLALVLHAASPAFAADWLPALFAQIATDPVLEGRPPNAVSDVVESLMQSPESASEPTAAESDNAEADDGWGSDDGWGDSDVGSFGAGETASLKGTFYTKYIRDLRKDDGFEDTAEFRNKLFIETTPRVGDVDWTLSALARHETFDGPDTSARWEANLWEAYALIIYDDFDLRVGQFIATWGKSFAINPTDVLNPKDMRELLFGEVDFYTQPIPMAKMDYYFGEKDVVELVVVPMYVPAKFERYGVDNAIVKREFLEEQQEDEEGFNALRFAESGVEPGQKEYPRSTPENFEVGMRYSSSVDRFDYSLMFFQGWSDIPTLYVSPDLSDYIASDDSLGDPIDALQTLSAAEIAPFFPYYVERPIRQNIFGVDGAYIIDDVGIKFESAYIDRQAFYREDLSVVDRPVLASTIGIDYTITGDSTVVAQYYNSRVFNHRPEIIFADESTDVLMLLYRDTWLQERLSLDAVGVVMLNDGQWVAAPRLNYDISDAFEVGVGINYLQGWGNDSIIEYFDQNDSWQVQAKVQF